MDIMTGLSAVSQALSIAKELKEIDRGVDEAAFKLKLAELQISLADAKIALSDAKLRISALEDQIASLTTGEICPVCKVGRLRVVKVEPDGFYFGGELHSVRCDHDACAYSTTRTYDPTRGIYSNKPE